MKQFLKYFIQGLILFIPLIITLAILSKLFYFFESLFSVFGFTDNVILNTVLGMIFTLGIISLVGLLASSFVFKQFFNYLEDKLEHAPFIRHIYSPIKDFTNAFVGNKKRFNKPVLVLTNPAAEIEEVGFITQEDLKDFHIKDKVAVYLPMSYSLSGRLIIVPAKSVKPLDADAGDTMKFVVSGGVTEKDE
ncbi:MAG: DUF502 domain-containing protein [Bacteroidetes bacterium]|nr:DUF502 domain-containing protein [Bacteroidota bacterium]